VARIEVLLALGEGYSHVHWAERSYPLLTLSFRGGYGVVFQFSSADKSSVLAGDGALGGNETVSVPVLDDDMSFRATGC
jgi:hypothetical protein